MTKRTVTNKKRASTPRNRPNHGVSTADKPVPENKVPYEATIADLKKGGKDAPGYRTLILPEFADKDGNPAVIYYLPLPIRAALKIGEARDAKNEDHLKMIVDELGKRLVKKDLTPLMTEDELLDMSLDTLVTIFYAIAGATGRGVEGNG